MTCLRFKIKETPSLSTIDSEEIRQLIYDLVERVINSIVGGQVKKSAPKKVLFNGWPGKMWWVFMQAFFYGVRPMMDKPKPLTVTELLNWVVVGGSDRLILHFWGVRSLVYLFAGEGNLN